MPGNYLFEHKVVVIGKVRKHFVGENQLNQQSQAFITS